MSTLHDESTLFAGQSLRDNQTFSIGKAHMSSMLPSLEIVDNDAAQLARANASPSASDSASHSTRDSTSHSTRENPWNTAGDVTARWDNTRGSVKEDHTFDWAKHNIRRDIANGGEPPRLSEWQQRIARGIEHNIMNGDLRNLQTMLHRYGGQAEELVPILREVRLDLQRHGISLNFRFDEKNHQCQVDLSQTNRLDFLTLSTDGRQPAKATRIHIEDDHGRLVSRAEFGLDPQAVMNKIKS
jgi:hypothetical protein